MLTHPFTYAHTCIRSLINLSHILSHTLTHPLPLTPSLTHILLTGYQLDGSHVPTLTLPLPLTPSPHTLLRTPFTGYQLDGSHVPTLTHPPTHHHIPSNIYMLIPSHIPFISGYQLDGSHVLPRYAHDFGRSNGARENHPIHWIPGSFTGDQPSLITGPLH